MIRKFLILNCIVWLTTLSLACQTPDPHTDTTIYTPRGIAISAKFFTGDDYTFYEADSLDNDYLADYPDATLIGSSSKKYNCHGYAWHRIEGGIDVWMNGLFDTTYYGYGLFPYIDGVKPSYIEVMTEQEATKIGYEIPNQTDSFSHSALPTNSLDTVISKWDKGPIMKHHFADCPYWYPESFMRYFQLLIPEIIGADLICDQEYYLVPSDSITNTTKVSWSVSSNLRIVSGANSSTVRVEPVSSVVYSDTAYVQAVISTVYDDIDSGEDVVVVIDTLRKEGLHVSNQPSNAEIHVPVEPIYGEVEAMVWASSDPGEESYDWQLSGGTIVSETGSEMTLIADCPSRKGITIGVKAINECGESAWVYRTVEIDCTGGINPLSILPNPADGYVDLTIDQTLAESVQYYDGKYEISVLDQSGILKFSTITFDNHLRIDTQNFIDGIYYIILKYAGKRYGRQLIISH